MIIKKAFLLKGSTPDKRETREFAQIKQLIHETQEKLLERI